MAPQEIPVLIDDNNLVSEPQSLKTHESPISTPGTSRESSHSPPAQPNVNMTDMNPTVEHRFVEDARNENWSWYSLGNSEENGNRSSSDDASRGSKKDRTTKCKTCEFVGKNKSEFYAHLREKICFTGPLLECEFEQCQFCTRYKHHFEYHQRNHYGSKPFKCEKCNYVCVNQSMLNSHMKSHSSQLPYKCKTCTYATKYLHSIKLHVKKYNHELDVVLKPDEAESQNLLISGNGKNRGSKSKKTKSSNPTEYHRVFTLNAPNPRPSSANYHQSPPLPTLNLPFMNNNPMFNSVAENGFFLSPMFDSSMRFVYPPALNLICTYPGCEYAAESTESMQHHLMLHIISRPQYELYGRNFNDFSGERHSLPECIRKPNSRFQDWNISRTQTHKLYQSRMREHDDLSGIPIPYKLPENSVAEYRVRSAFSPPLSYRDIAPDSFLARHTGNSRHVAQAQFIKNRERSNILRPIPIISPPSMEQTRGSSRSSIDTEDAENCCSPLDLTVNISRPTVVNPLTITSEQEKNRQYVEPFGIQPQQTIKNRRKGKAFKIDQSMQYED